MPNFWKRFIFSIARRPPCDPQDASGVQLGSVFLASASVCTFAVGSLQHQVFWRQESFQRNLDEHHRQGQRPMLYDSGIFSVLFHTGLLGGGFQFLKLPNKMQKVSGKNWSSASEPMWPNHTLNLVRPRLIGLIRLMLLLFLLPFCIWLTPCQDLFIDRHNQLRYQGVEDRMTPYCVLTHVTKSKLINDAFCVAVYRSSTDMTSY